MQLRVTQPLVQLQMSLENSSNLIPQPRLDLASPAPAGQGGLLDGPHCTHLSLYLGFQKSTATTLVGAARP